MMYSSPAHPSAAAIYFTCVVPSDSAKFALKSPAISSSAPQGRLLMAATVFSMVKDLSGAM